MARIYLFVCALALAACTPSPPPEGNTSPARTADGASTGTVSRATPAGGPPTIGRTGSAVPVAATPTRAATPGTSLRTALPARTATRLPTPGRASSAAPTALPPLRLPTQVASLLYVRDGDVGLWDGTNNAWLTTGAPVALAPAPQVAPDGRRALIVRTAGSAGSAPYPRQTVTILDLVTHVKTPVDMAALPAAPGTWPIVVSAEWLPGGRSVLLRTTIAGEQTTAGDLLGADDYYRVDTRTGKLTFLADLDGVPGAGSTQAGAPAVSPDGGFAAIPSAEGVILLDLRQGDVVTVLPFASGEGPAVFPALGWAAGDGILFAVTPIRASESVVFWQVDVRTSSVLELGRLPASIVDLAGHPPRWSPDGRWVGWANAQGLAYIAPAAVPDALQPWSTQRLTALLGWSPDGSALVAAGKNGHLLALNPVDPTAAPVFDYAGPAGTGGWQVAWAGGTLLATARQAQRSLIVVRDGGAAGAAPGPPIDWGFAPTAVTLR